MCLYWSNIYCLMSPRYEMWVLKYIERDLHASQEKMAYVIESVAIYVNNQLRDTFVNCDSKYLCSFGSLVGVPDISLVSDARCSFLIDAGLISLDCRGIAYHRDLCDGVNTVFSPPPSANSTIKLGAEVSRDTKKGIGAAILAI